MTLIPRLPEHAGRSIEQFLRVHLDRSGLSGAMIGLSGGIDSAVTAHLARDALGPERVTGVVLPDAGFPEPLIEETRSFATHLGIRHLSVPIGAIEDAFQGALGSTPDRIAVGNTKARIRMILLYSLARQHRALVVGTGNKSEILLGYFTKHGDGGVDLLPIGDLYKTQVQRLAAELDVPAPIRERAPTAGFWEGQTDEAELGASYAQLDEVLAGIEQLRSEEEIVRIGHVPAELVTSVTRRVAENRHKRRSPPIPKLGLRTVGVDWRD